VRKRLPSLREVTRQLRAINDAWAADGEWEFCALTFSSEQGWTVEVLDSLFHDEQYGREWVPGKANFDAVGAARRLLADAREGIR
jgi:hypothetical protein